MTRLRLASAEQPVATWAEGVETYFERGWSDGLPVVPATEDAVWRFLEAVGRVPGDVVITEPVRRRTITAEKVAINAVLAGCKPEYLPVVLACIEAACTDEFNMHGLLATTYFAAPVVVVNGPVTKRIGMNSGVNVLGQGNRANCCCARR